MLHAFTDVHSLKPNTLLFLVLISHWNGVQETINTQHRYTYIYICICLRLIILMVFDTPEFTSRVTTACEQQKYESNNISLKTQSCRYYETELRQIQESEIHHLLIYDVIQIFISVYLCYYSTNSAISRKFKT